MLRRKPIFLRLLIVGILLAIAVFGLLLGGTTESRADESSGITPTPTTANSTITVHFVQNGSPVIVSFLSFPKRIAADGKECLYPVREFTGSEFSLAWPLPSQSGQPEECTKGPPTTVSLEFDGVSAEIVWEGNSPNIDVNVPASSTPAQLPATGGPTDTSAGAFNQLTLGIAALAIAVGFLTLMRLRTTMSSLSLRVRALPHQRVESRYTSLIFWQASCALGSAGELTARSMVYDLDSIKQRNPIADVIAAHGIALRESGAHLLGRCPLSLRKRGGLFSCLRGRNRIAPEADKVWSGRDGARPPASGGNPRPSAWEADVAAQPLTPASKRETTL